MRQSRPETGFYCGRSSAQNVMETVPGAKVRIVKRNRVYMAGQAAK